MTETAMPLLSIMIELLYDGEGSSITRLTLFIEISYVIVYGNW